MLTSPIVPHHLLLSVSPNSLQAVPSKNEHLSYQPWPRAKPSLKGKGPQWVTVVGE